MQTLWRSSIVLIGLGLAVLSFTPHPAVAAGAAVHGGGSTSGMTRFALAVENGTGHFECLMPKLMTVEATVTQASLSSPTSAVLEGTATVTLAEANPFGLPAGPLARGAPFTAQIVAGGPGVGSEDLTIMGMDFPGLLEHGQISIGG